MALIPARTTIFEFMSARAVARGAVNLGQGFPDAAGPDSVREMAAKALIEGPHHYPRMRGIDSLREALADFYATSQGLAYDPVSEIVVTSGATEALAAAILGIVRPGDGALILEPAYDAYAPLVRRAGGLAQFARLSPPEWQITSALLEAAITPETRVLIVNDPCNPTGHMLHESERFAIRDIALKYDLTIIADEVWEEVRPQNRPHISLASDPALFDRVIKIGSAGKIFQVTGWKIGWAMAAAPLAERVAATHQFLAFTTAPALQYGVAHGLMAERCWLHAMRAQQEASRAKLAQGLENLGLVVLPSEASWFLNIDLKASGLPMTDVQFCTRLVDEFGVAAIPVSAFAEGDAAGLDHVVRFCHAKSEQTIDAALKLLGPALEKLRQP